MTNPEEMPLKEGDTVVIKSVSGHGDIRKAIGRTGVIKNVREEPPFDDYHVWYKYQVKYTHPIECTCPKHCGRKWLGDWFASDEIEYTE